MPTFQDPAIDADAAQQALRALAHATRAIDDPRQIYAVLGSVTAATTSLRQTLHQIASFHDGGPHAGQATAIQVSWELHRSGEILRQVAESIAHAHEAEATITYDHRDVARVTNVPPRQSVDHGLGL